MSNFYSSSNFDESINYFFLPLQTQLEIIKEHNDSFPIDVRASPKMFSEIELDDVEQDIKNYSFLFVAKENPIETYIYAMAMLKQRFDERLSIKMLDIYKTKNIKLDQNAQDYEPGLYQITLNLIEGWPNKDSEQSSIYQHRNKANDQNLKIAGTEILSAFAMLTSAFARNFDGSICPILNLSGICEGSISKNSFCLLWDKPINSMIIKKQNEFETSRNRISLTISNVKQLKCAPC